MEVYFILILLVLVALAIGSFVSAVSYRIPRDLNFSKGRSFCDLCQKYLKWYDNIPLFSYFFYFGKSRCCGQKISIRYPLIEAASVLGACILFLLFPFLEFILYYSLFVTLLTILVIDIEHQIIPDELVWLTLLISILIVNTSLLTTLFFAFLFSTFLLSIYILTSGKGMGLGDVKLAIPLGLVLGQEKGLVWLLSTFIIGGIVALFLLVLKKAKLKTKIAFGPFMIVAFWITLML
ncbi:MAG: prepilin peptidase [bacterium]|nr:MAG: prepilin peptidase [bacterium]